MGSMTHTTETEKDHPQPASLCHNCMRWRPAEAVQQVDRGEGAVQLCSSCSHGVKLPTLPNPMTAEKW